MSTSGHQVYTSLHSSALDTLGIKEILSRAAFCASKTYLHLETLREQKKGAWQDFKIAETLNCDELGDSEGKPKHSKEERNMPLKYSTETKTSSQD